MHVKSYLLVASLCVAASALPTSSKQYKYAGIFSVDGFHSSDVGKWVTLRPNSNIAALLATGYEYTDAWTSAPSDSFPGTINQYTGASPRTTGVWYDDTWDRSFYPPYYINQTHCGGEPGAEVLYDESLDYNSTFLFSGGIDPVNLPQKMVNGKCVKMYPHNRVRVNTIFEVAHEAGKQTAYTDKHPAYDIVRGPSGTGLTVGYFPEIAAVNVTVDATIEYDKYHVQAWLDWISGTTPTHSEIQGQGLTGPPALFGGNFQSMSVAQKTVGYNNNSSNSLSDAIIKAMDFVDESFGQLIAAAKAKGIYDDMLWIVASKHGQAPINRSLFRTVNDSLIAPATGVAVDWVTADDIALIFLKDQSTLDKAVAGLQAHASQLQIKNIIYGDALIDQGYGNPKTDPAVPDIIVQPELGVVYTTSTSKFAEHGGLSKDDRNVACFVSAPGLQKQVIDTKVSTRQVAVTALTALGLDASKLQGAVIEGTHPLPGF